MPMDIGGTLASAAKGAAMGSALGPVGSAFGAALGVGLELAPQLSRWIVGDDGSTAGKIVQTVRSVTGTTDPAAQAAAVANPQTAADLRIALAQIGAEREREHEQARLDEFKAAMANTASARAQTIALAERGSVLAWGAPVVSVLVMLAFGGTMWAVLFRPLPAGSEQVAIGLVEILKAMAIAVVSYWVGSSAGSARKDDRAANEKAQAAVTAPPPTTAPAPLPARLPIPVPVLPTRDGSSDTPPPSREWQSGQPVVLQPPMPQPVVEPGSVTPDPRAQFFADIRMVLFSGRLVQSQVEGTERILDHWHATYPNGDERHLAYVLATAYWETGRTMQPIEEYGRGEGRAYGKTGFWGRGLVQLTHEENYAKLSPIAGVDLVAHPEAALTWDVALPVLFEGMLQGLFTGKRLADYFNGAKEDALGARAIVNGTDKAKEIANFYRAFLGALRMGEA